MNSNFFRIILYPIFYIRNVFLEKKKRSLAKKYPVRYINKYHKKYYKKPLDLIKPRTLHEKIFWLEYNTDTSQWSKLTDKLAVREYVERKGLKEILNPVYAVYTFLPNNLKSIIENLPNQFVLKTNNNGGGTAIIIKNKKTINHKKVYRQLKRYFYDDYGIRTAQPHYSKIKTKIIAEKLLINDKNPDSSLDDYKFFCFNGNPLIVNVIQNRNLENHSFIDQFYTISWDRILYGQSDDSTPSIEKPSSYDTMVSIAKTLSSQFPFVRVDLYEVDKRPIFGEMTFTPGFDTFCYYGDRVLHLGDYVDIGAFNNSASKFPSSF